MPSLHSCLPLEYFAGVATLLVCVVAWGLCLLAAVATLGSLETSRQCRSWATVWLAVWIPAAALFGLMATGACPSWASLTGLALLPALALVYGLRRRAKFMTKLAKWDICSAPAVSLAASIVVMSLYHFQRDLLTFQSWFQCRDALMASFSIGPIRAMLTIITLEFFASRHPQDSAS